MPEVKNRLRRKRQTGYLLILTWVAFAAGRGTLAGSRLKPTVRITCHGGVIYAEVGPGRMAAVGVAQKKVLWTFEDSGLEAFFPPAFTDSHVILLASNGDNSQVVALTRTSGGVVWRRPFTGVASRSSPSVCGGRLLLNDYHTGEETALDAGTGREVWTFRGASVQLLNPPAVNGNQAWFVSRLSKEETAFRLAQVDCSDGKLLQSIPIPGGDFSLHPVLLHEGKAILSADRMEKQPGWVILFDPLRREPVWRLPFFHRMDHEPLITHGRLIGSVWAVDLATGNQLFDYSPVAGESASFCVWSDLLIYRRDERAIVAVDIRAKRTAWRSRLASPLRSNVVECGEAVCVMVAGQKLAVVKASDGTLSYYIPVLAQAHSGN